MDLRPLPPPIATFTCSLLFLVPLLLQELMERDKMIEQFLNVFPAQSPHTATQFLDASGWDLAAAIDSVLAGSYTGGGRAPPFPRRPRGKRSCTGDETERPVKRAQDNWESQRLRSLYRPPLEMMYNGSFEQAKNEACVKKKWVLVNLQSRKEFDSHLLNRDTWANETLAQTIPSHFVFWQEDHEDSMEGKKVCAFYKIDSIPAVLVIDPFTGQKMRGWKGMVRSQRLLEDLMPFLEKNPFECYFCMASQSQTSLKTKTCRHETLEIPHSPPPCIIDEEKEEKELKIRKRATYPTLPEEPAEGDSSLLCRIAVRLPDGRKLERNFLQTDPVQLLWSFCESQLEEKDCPNFQLKLAIPGSPLTLEYQSSTLTFHESKLSNSLITIDLE